MRLPIKRKAEAGKLIAVIPVYERARKSCYPGKKNKAVRGLFLPAIFWLVALAPALYYRGQYISGGGYCRG